MEARLAAARGTYWMAARSAPAAMPAATSATRRTSRQPDCRSVAYPAAVASVAASETGSPARAWVAIVAASRVTADAVRRSSTRSSAQNTNGTAATDHDMFGKFVVDTIGPETANATAPNAAAGGRTCRAR